MIPTEQDKELRIAIHERMIAFRREDGNGYVDRCIEHLDNVMQLITTDRKRVELEARIDELSMVDAAYHHQIEMKVEVPIEVAIDNGLNTIVLDTPETQNDMFRHIQYRLNHLREKVGRDDTKHKAQQEEEPQVDRDINT